MPLVDMNARRLFLAAYTCSGIAGLIYQVTWARLFGLYLGHSSAAASAVLAAFMAGLSIGAIGAGRLTDRLSPRRALHAYALLELIVLVSAAAVPRAMEALAPSLRTIYDNGSGTLLFGTARLILCIGVLFVPSFTLGATFPVGVRWFNRSGPLYTANTAGAAIGALATGFLLMPSLGHWRTIFIGAIFTAASACIALVLARRSGDAQTRPATRPLLKRTQPSPEPDARWIGLTILALTGFATFVFELAWMRLFAMVFGPSTYAFSATVSAFIVALAVGSSIGTFAAARTGRAPLLALTLAAAAICTCWAASYAGTTLPRHVAQELAASTLAYGSVLTRQVVLVSSIVMPGAIALGIAFPIALEMAAGHGVTAARRAGLAYGINALASVAGSLGAGFITIPLLGLQPTIRIGAAVLLAGALAVATRMAMPRLHRNSAFAVVTAGAVFIVLGPDWDRARLAGGVYHTPAANAGTLLYYREGATGTVSVTSLNGVRSLSIDGKVDASTSDDMLTQKMLAHLPLLLHADPRSVGIIGLGSGVTLASALTHPVQFVDVIELSPQVVEASQYFDAVNRYALRDPRTRLIVGDGRSHLLLATKEYDVIISEPSNPWMAGVASLFTGEFFRAARNRLAPRGVLCQWAHTYNMSDADLRSIAATFASVFPNGTMWLVGSGDLLLVGSKQESDIDLSALDRAPRPAEVLADLSEVSAQESFARFSMFVGGPATLRSYGANAEIQTDDRMRLEFSAPVAMFGRIGADNAGILRRLRSRETLPAPVARSMASPGAAQWRNRGAMMMAAGAHDEAYDDFARAVAVDPADQRALTGLVGAALATGRVAGARVVLEEAASRDHVNPSAWIAMSRLFASAGNIDAALTAVLRAGRIAPDAPECLEQLAAVYADAGDAQMLAVAAERLRRVFPERASGHYYAAAGEFMVDRLEPALTLARDATRLDASYADAHNLQGAILARLGQAPAARQAFETALRLNPRDGNAYRNFGLLEMASGNRADAARLFGEALALDPTSEANRQSLADALAY